MTPCGVNKIAQSNALYFKLTHCQKWASSVLSLKYLYITGRLIKSLPGALDFLQDLPALRPPDVTLGMLVALGQAGDDRLGQLPDAGEAAFADGILSDIAEKALHQV